MLVKGALQCVKDTDIHENIQPVDLNHVLECLVEPYLAPHGNGRVTLDGAALSAYPGKPLALKRCIGNLIDNALKYGQNAHLHIEDDGVQFILHVDDEGPVCRSSDWSRCLSRTSAWPASSRVTDWDWGLRAILPTAMGAK